jgi:epoxyqueuosine reductase
LADRATRSVLRRASRSRATPERGETPPARRGAGEAADQVPSVSPPVASGTSKRVYRQTSQDVCPYSRKFSIPLKEPAFAPRPAIAGKDARTLATELLGMSQEEFSSAFRGSPMKRAKLPAMKRNATVVLGNVGTVEDLDVLTRALDDADPLVREHAAWALARLQR